MRDHARTGAALPARTGRAVVGLKPAALSSELDPAARDTVLMQEDRQLRLEGDAPAAELRLRRAAPDLQHRGQGADQGEGSGKGEGESHGRDTSGLVRVRRSWGMKMVNGRLSVLDHLP